MDQQMFECSDNDLMMKGKDKEELKRYGKMHVKDMHGMDISDEDLEKDIKPAQA